MDFKSNIVDVKRYIGLILFSVGVIMYILMLFNPLNYSFIHIDEWYTLSLVQMSFIDGLKLTAADVHPPLYYLIVKFVLKILIFFKIPFDMIYVSKIVTSIPYFLVLALSGTKIRNKYGWITAGILVFALGTMSEFFLKFITLRMYGWGLIFLLLAYIYLDDILTNSDTKSWILITIFSVLGAYTHYFIAITVVLMYLGVLIYNIFIRDYNDEFIMRNEIKKWFISVIGGILLFIPWVPVLYQQLHTPGNYWIPELDFNNVISFISYYATNSQNDILVWLSIIFLAVLFIITFMTLKKDSKQEISYILIGIFSVIGTFLLLLGFSIISHPILLPRYLMPIISILWLIFAIVIGKLENKYILIAVLCLILLFGISGILETHAVSGDLYDLQTHDKNLLAEMDTNNSVIIHTNGINVIMFNKFLNSTEQYSLSNRFGDQLHHSLDFKEKHWGDVKKIINKNEGKSIYIIKNKGGKMPNLGFNMSAEKIDEICNSREVFIVN